MVGPSSVIGRVEDGLANREFGGSLVTMGGGCIVGGEAEGQARNGGWVARNTEGEGGHIGSTLDVGRAGVVGYGIGGTASYHGKGKLGGTRLHELARIAMISSMSRRPPMSGHPAMEVAIEAQF